MGLRILARGLCREREKCSYVSESTDLATVRDREKGECV
jgi:hypothetical protein